MKADRYFLDQDDDCHWYLIKAANRSEWLRWRESGSESVPAYATQIDGPSRIEFYEPKAR